MDNLYSKYEKKLTKVWGVIREFEGHSLAKDVSEHVFHNPGKNLRPLLMHIIAQGESEEVTKLSAAISLIHQATLLHDDVIDHSSQRRNRPTVNMLWNNRIGILVGDFFLARAFDLVVEVGNIKVMGEINKAIKKLIEGELDHMQSEEEIISFEKYESIIYNKTASLFEVCASIGCLVASSDLKQENFVNYAKNLGMAFQISDDLLDYDKGCSLGKKCGDDFKEGKITYPVLIAIHDGVALDFWQEKILKNNQKDGDFEEAFSILQKNKIFEKTLEKISQYTKDALKAIEKTDQNIFEDLEVLLNFGLNRAKKFTY